MTIVHMSSGPSGSPWVVACKCCDRTHWRWEDPCPHKPLLPQPPKGWIYGLDTDYLVRW